MTNTRLHDPLHSLKANSLLHQVGHLDRATNNVAISVTCGISSLKDCNLDDEFTSEILIKLQIHVHLAILQIFIVCSFMLSTVCLSNPLCV
jgi:hypothetical protein